MTKIVVNQRTCAQFLGFNEPLQFVDENGHLLGLFMSNVDPSKLKPRIGEDEIKRRLAEGGGRPLADIIKDLE